MKLKLWIAGGLTMMTVSAMAAFTTSEVGTGSYVAGGSVGDIIKNLLASDGYEAVELSDLSSLATALGGGSASFDYASNDSLAIFDVDNDGKITKSEFVDVLANMADISGISTAGNGKYAQAYATELGALSSPLISQKFRPRLPVAISTPLMRRKSEPAAWLSLALIQAIQPALRC